MKSPSSGWVILLGAFVLGGAIGFGCGQAEKKSTAVAKADEVAPAAGQAAAPTPKKPRRFGSVVGLKPEKKDYYNKLHAEPWPEINAMLKKCNIQNYSIYEGEVDGKLYLFAYFEYTGDDYQADMKRMADDPKTQEWWKETGPCQTRLPGTPDGEQWLPIPEVYHLD